MIYHKGCIISETTSLCWTISFYFYSFSNLQRDVNKEAKGCQQWKLMYHYVTSRKLSQARRPQRNLKSIIIIDCVE